MTAGHIILLSLFVFLPIQREYPTFSRVGIENLVLRHSALRLRRNLEALLLRV